MDPTTPTRLQCPLCGFAFEKGSAVCHHGCPFGRFCKLIRCPSCQYEFPEPSRPLTWLARLLHPAGPAPARGALDLTQLEDGETVEFVAMTGSPEPRRHTLAVYGLVPGARIVLQQKRPTYILRIGETELALDTEIARQISVRRTAAPVP